MQQLLQNLTNGQAVVANVPAPRPQRGELLVRVAASLISAGTERTAIEFAEKNIFQKAAARPDLVRQVLNKAGREGVLSTLDAVRHRLDTHLALGYSNAGVVIETGPEVSGFAPGDRVACAGLGYASHAEIVRVPRNLVAKIPAVRGRPELGYEEAAFTTIGAIAMQGLRLAQLELGESVVVIGLGLIGLVAVQLAKAAGCTVIGMDPVTGRCALAERLMCDATAQDAEDLANLVAVHTAGAGADAVIITAATSSSAPVATAGEVARERGRVVAVGAVGMEIPRKIYYEKELSFHVSRSYGPGRYDPEYEEKGRDYPLGFVRWTENRNMRAFLQLLAEGKVDVKSLITHRFAINEANQGYALISGKTGEPFLGVVVTYDEPPSLERRVNLRQPEPRTTRRTDRVRVGMIGAGSFATSVLLPAIKSVQTVELAGVCAMTGASARGVGARTGFAFCTTDESELLRDGDIDTVVIATRHHLHARQVVAALSAGKNVFCEKPLCINKRELGEIIRVHQAQSGSRLMVGFNRRFSPLALEMRDFVRGMREPLMMQYRVNAGLVPSNHWVQDPEQGAGRIIGEVCHFVDLLAFLAGQPVVSTHAVAIPNNDRYRDDNLAITLRFADGSVGSVTYTAAGDKSFPKERLEVFGGGSVAVLEDFRRLDKVRNGKARVSRAYLRQDKGHRGEWQEFASAILKSGPSPIEFHQLVNTSLTTFAICESLACGHPQSVESGAFISSVLAASPQEAATE